MKILGWTMEQIAYAHSRAGENDVTEDAAGILRLRREWWEKRLPDPLEVQFDMVPYDIPGDSVLFAHNAMVSAMEQLSSNT